MAAPSFRSFSSSHRCSRQRRRGSPPSSADRRLCADHRRASPWPSLARAVAAERRDGGTHRGRAYAGLSAIWADDTDGVPVKGSASRPSRCVVFAASSAARSKAQVRRASLAFVAGALRRGLRHPSSSPKARHPFRDEHDPGVQARPRQARGDPSWPCHQDQRLGVQPACGDVGLAASGQASWRCASSPRPAGICSQYCSFSHCRADRHLGA